MVRLSDGVTLAFRNLAVTNYRVGSFIQASGFDLLVPGAAGDRALVRLEGGAFIFRLCFPLPVAMQSLNATLNSRPAWIPGSSTYVLPEPLPPGCVNDTAAPLLDRCYAYGGRYVDVAAPGNDIGPSGSPVTNGYALHFLDVRGLCASVLSDECVAKLGPLVCLLSTINQPPLPPAPPPAPPRPAPPPPAPAPASAAPHGPPGSAMPGDALLQQPPPVGPGGGSGSVDSRAPSDGSGASRRLGLGLGCGLGGGVIVALLFGAALCHDSIQAEPELRQNVKGSKGGAGGAGPTATTSADGAGPGAAPLSSSRAAAALAGTPSLSAADYSAASRPDSSSVPDPSSSSGHVDEGSLGSSVLGGGGGPSGSGGDDTAVTLLPTVLGKGACGRVYEGLYGGRKVAVKVILTDDLEGLFGVLPEEAAAWPAPAPVPQLGCAQRGPGLEVANNAPSGGALAAEGPPAAEAEAGLAEGPRPPAPAAAAGNAVAPDGGHQDRAPPERAAEPRVGGPAAAEEARRAALREERQVQLFAAEVAVLGRCDHPNVVRLLAACLTPPRLCLVMERCETSLERLMYGGGGAGGGDDAGGAAGGVGRGEGSGRGALLPLPTLLHIAIQICQGLEYLHPTIVHRDLKPANVLINGADTDRPVAKLADFGLARISAMTMATRHPEAGTDMYSLGVLLWAMLTGQQPWKNTAIPAVAYKVASLGERLPLDHLPDRRCPPQLRRLIRQCWEADPLRRPAAAEAVKELHLLQREPVHPRLELLSATAANVAANGGAAAAAGDDDTDEQAYGDGILPYDGFLPFALPLVAAAAVGAGPSPPSLVRAGSSPLMSEAALAAHLGDLELEIESRDG
ncbi:hypothetical protein GPECTOR_37g209 [Gonium pectorale]|uniref:Protein kinase domain-containing protein n=1 Tax=Gonium pectorale TaxID=33097 RepID=A0A150GBQ7_GONPE|nr:hypothetical protein GPECTOR_37g209 [Gonium pectorale]|eukprot:KXZ47203.1 hypothetical protein GPECTOR_37g209 [Gonium pectorale]